MVRPSPGERVWRVCGCVHVKFCCQTSGVRLGALGALARGHGPRAAVTNLWLGAADNIRAVRVTGPVGWFTQVLRGLCFLVTHGLSRSAQGGRLCLCPASLPLLESEMPTTAHMERGSSGCTVSSIHLREPRLAPRPRERGIRHRVGLVSSHADGLQEQLRGDL